MTPDSAGAPTESWIELNLVPVRELDRRLLTELVPALVHGELATEIETWFFFWEPELRLRIRWRDGSRAQAGATRLAERIEQARREGLVVDWYEGAHGERGATYVGEAEAYGHEVWSQVQKDWMNGSELAVLLVGLDAGAGLTVDLPFHWSRHVHLFTNQLYGTWSAEIELCLNQALGYLRHLQSSGAPPSPATRSLIEELAAELRRAAP
jgi:hypothetical protein